MDSLYAWGENRYKQTSSKEDYNIYSPLKHKEFEAVPVAQVAAGDYHSLVLTDGGDVYSFGRGSQGELGHQEKKNIYIPKIISTLKNETCVDIACGSSTSFAITASGKVYQWGLILKEMNSNIISTTNTSSTTMNTTTDNHTEEFEYEAASGQLTGLAQDQHTTYIEADIEAREEFMSFRHHGGRGGGGEGTERRQLRDIVKDSTEKWMIAGDGADDEYLRQLTALGYQNEDIQALKNNKEKEYHGMLRLGCKRVVQPIPQLIRGIAHLKIMKVSAGYAHCMVISDIGYLYAAGYNDRGQLGLGHRISTSEFKWVDYLANQFVVQVACGQQHTLCRAIDRSAMTQTHTINEICTINNLDMKSSHILSDQYNNHNNENNQRMSEIYVGSNVGCNAYSWGNSMLGQLGLGRKGTSKGRFLPTLIPYFYDKCPNSIQDVSAGHMFSVVVTVHGTVFSFGHAEYNQHGTGGRAYKDYTDPYHYFEPRQVMIRRWNLHSDTTTNTTTATNTTTSNNTSVVNKDQELNEQLACISKVFCGSNYTIGIDIEGHAYSWGWNESGVLGHGVGYISSSPTIIRSLTMSSSNINESHICRRVIHVATGAKHVLAITTDDTYNISTHYQYLLNDGTYADMKILVDPLNNGHIQSITCHSMILASRSAYFRGYLLKLTSTHKSMNREFHESHNSSLINDDDNKFIVLELDLCGYEFMNITTIEVIVKYIYTTQYPTTWIGKKKQQLIYAAQFLCLYDLVDLLTTTSYNNHIENTYSGNNQLAINNIHVSDTKVNKETQRFYQDFITLFTFTPYFADVVFTYRLNNNDKQNNSENTDNQIQYIYTHKAILTQMNYFEGMFHSHFKESLVSADTLYTVPQCTPQSDPESHPTITNNMTNHTDIATGNTYIKYTNVTLGNTVKTTLPPTMMTIDLESILDEDMSYDTFMILLYYAYTAQDPFISWIKPVDSWTKGTNNNTDTNTRDNNDNNTTTGDETMTVTDDVNNNNNTTKNDNTLSAVVYNKDDLYTIINRAISLCIASNRLGYTRLFTICENKLLTHLKDDYPYIAQLCLQVAQDYTFLKLERQCLHILRFANHLNNNV